MMTEVEQNYIDSLHSLGNAYPFRMTLNTPSLVWIGNRYCDIVDRFGAGEVLESVTNTLEQFSGSRQGAAFIQAEANHWLCPNLAYLNLPAVPRPGGRSGIEVGPVPEFPSMRVAPNPSLPPGWPTDNSIPAAVQIDKPSDEDHELVQQIREDGAKSQDPSLLASAAYETCTRTGGEKSQYQVEGELVLLYPGLSYTDAQHVSAVAQSRLCGTPRAAAQQGSSGTATSEKSDASGPDDLVKSLSTFLPAGYDPEVLAEKIEEQDYGAQSCSGLKKGTRYQVSGAGQFLMYVYGEGVVRDLDPQDLSTFFRLVIEHYCPENQALIPE
ncbi:hypothetical protein GS489_00915 [Rhodococcus hoagii]|nr:hypothetical protein [Prescottella equi]